MTLYVPAASTRFTATAHRTLHKIPGVKKRIDHRESVVRHRCVSHAAIRIAPPECDQRRRTGRHDRLTGDRIPDQHFAPPLRHTSAAGNLDRGQRGLVAGYMTDACVVIGAVDT